MDSETLRQYLEFYQDLGVKALYRRAPSANVSVQPIEASTGEMQVTQASAAASGSKTEQPSSPNLSVHPERGGSSTRSDLVLPSMTPPNETLLQILQDLGDCRRCRLHEGRTKLVFGVGNERSPLVFVGEGPGADEDEQGIPFVGKAGQLLTQMIENTAKREGISLQRDDVYICNVVKCRPPGNRTPEPDEMEICGEFLYRQLTSIRPKAICALGGTAARAVTGHKEGVTKMRGKWFSWRDTPVMVTYHPSYLLRQYNQAAKREAWEDLKKLLHFVYD
jgi:DNA polymerase